METPKGAQKFSLSVLMFVGRSSLLALEDALTCLDGQTDQRFELILLGEDLDRDDAARLRELMGKYSSNLASKTRFLLSSEQDREVGADLGLLQEAISQSTGIYISITNASVLVFGSWVSAFRALAARATGSVLHLIGTDQSFASEPWPRGGHGFVPVDGPTPPRAKSFSPVDQLTFSDSPFGSFALPRHVALEELTRMQLPGRGLVSELIYRVALSEGVVDEVNDLMSIRRAIFNLTWGYDAQAAEEEIGKEIVARLDASPLILPPGSASKIRGLLLTITALQDELEKRTTRDQQLVRERDFLTLALQKATNEASSEVADGELEFLGAELSAMHRSNSWRITAPLRLMSTVANRLRRSASGDR